jgi:hypothetical protein
VRKRLLFVEVFALANLVAIAVLTRGREYGAVRPSWRWVVVMGMVLFGQAAAGIAVRLVIDLVRRRRAYLRRIRRPEWIIETLRIVVASAVVSFTYGWIKQVIPALHPGLFDQLLWDVDQTVFFGLAPTLFVLDLFGNHLVLRAIDWSYAFIFYASTMVAGAYFFSEPSRRIRLAFTNGNAVLWLVGGWLYLLVPSLGPAFRFPDLWLAYDQSLLRTQHLQTLLMKNYQNVLRAIRGEPHDPLNMVFSIAAFPSLHVAFQTYVFFWMRRLWTSGEVLFGVFAAAIFLGSMVTGWHYFIDSLAGLLLAYACFRIFWGRARMSRFVRLF